MIEKKVVTVTNLIIFINIVVFIVMMFSGNPYLFIAKYGLNSHITPPYITFVTHAFIHADIFHIGFNMFFLFMFGPVLENYFGKFQYALLYICLAVLGGALTSFFTTSLTIGASGILYSFMTIVLALSKSNIPDFYIANENGLIKLFLFNLLLSLVIPGVSIIGHLSGVVAGIIVSLVVITAKERQRGKF